MAINISAGMTRACEELPRARTAKQLSLKLSTVDQTVHLTSDTVEVTIVIGMYIKLRMCTCVHSLSSAHAHKQSYCLETCCVCTQQITLCHPFYMHIHTYMYVISLL